MSMSVLTTAPDPPEPGRKALSIALLRDSPLIRYAAQSALSFAVGMPQTFSV